MRSITDQKPKKRPVNLTITADLLDEAKSMNLNASQAAEEGIARALSEAKKSQWLEENKAAIEAHNERSNEHGTLLTPHWSQEE